MSEMVDQSSDWSRNLINPLQGGAVETSALASTSQRQHLNKGFLNLKLMGKKQKDVIVGEFIANWLGRGCEHDYNFDEELEILMDIPASDLQTCTVNAYDGCIYNTDKLVLRNAVCRGLKSMLEELIKMDDGDERDIMLYQVYHTLQVAMTLSDYKPDAVYNFSRDRTADLVETFPELVSAWTNIVAKEQGA